MEHTINIEELVQDDHNLNRGTKEGQRLMERSFRELGGEWTGGADVDAGATNRKLGSDMADGVTGGGLHGKDLSKADVSVNIWCFLEAQRTCKPVQAFCAIGDTEVNGVPYAEIVETARKFINDLGGFEKFAEWGLF